MAGSLFKRVLNPGGASSTKDGTANNQTTTVAAIRHPIAQDEKPNLATSSAGTGTPDSKAPDTSPIIQKEDKETAKLYREIQAAQANRKRRLELAQAAASEPDSIRNRYGPLIAKDTIESKLNSISPDYATSLTALENNNLELASSLIGKRVSFYARIHTARALSSRLGFFLFRNQIETLQGVLHYEQGTNSTHMIRWAEHLPSESIVHVTGTVQVPKNAENKNGTENPQVYSATIKNVEVNVESLHLLSRARDLRFHVYSAELSAKAHAEELREQQEASGASAIGDGSGAHITQDEDNEDDDDEDEDDDKSNEQQDELVASPRDSISGISAVSSTKSSKTGTKTIQNISLRTRLANRIIDIRTPASLSIFRLQSALCSAFRSYLADQNGFLEIHTPKLQGGATESGSSVFQLDYFGRQAFLAQSPQLAKQMAISGDFQRVFEIGPVFRAENSNTHRHLTEYTGLDIEMTISNDYHEVMRMIDSTLKYMFGHIYKNYRRELDVVQETFPHHDLVWLDETPVLRFPEAVKMLNDSGWTDEDGNPLKEDEDLGTRDEIRLGQLMKEKHNTDYYIIDKFPASVRPFYTMPDKDNPKWTNSFDFFLRGQEILTGGQRIHQLKKLERAMVKNGVQPEDMREYCEAFQFGAPPHGGAGIGLERLLMLLLQLGDIRNASLFPRDPQSLPQKPPQTSLRYPDASTLHPPWERNAIESDDPMADFDDDLDEDEVEGILRDGARDGANLGGGQSDETKKLGHLQPLGQLIANYGHSTSTAILDDRYRVWRHAESGSAVSYVPVDRFAIVVGNPLCDQSQYARVMRHFLGWLKRETRLKPIWILVDNRVQSVLGEQYGWCTLSCIAEERASTITNPAFHDGEIQRRVRHAEREGLKISDVPQGEPVPEDVVRECEEGMQKWLASRKGKQAHLTQLNPWRDMEHRHYCFARDKSGRIVSFVVLAMLSKSEGYQVKYSLDWEGAPSGTIEAITLHAIKAAASLGAKSVTFGAGAASTIEVGHHIGSIQAAALRRTYKSIVASRGLARKTAFRAKMGADDSASEDRLWVTYPKGGLGPRGIRALLSFFGDPEEEEEEDDEVDSAGALTKKTSKKAAINQSNAATATTANAASKTENRSAGDTSPQAKEAQASARTPENKGADAAGSQAPTPKANAKASATATSKPHEDEASGKQQIVHSTRAEGGEAGASTASEQTGAGQGAEDGRSRSRSRSRSRGGQEGNTKKRFSGLFSHVLKRHGGSESHGGASADAQPSPAVANA
ncbi:aspartate--tRNA ligase dps1 [Tilletia horrida]|uniref:Probable aspartate--tRNA ligase, cytoplasmic n=1 Tax=Tilletia horrida TaxID=155126 RepID=A0AAN6GV71_9BASI|nr:aspartate--tRNA ligase dps1 [Tilletia horrida]KAK0567897.1 aspartate--tRNA ligase dps1 [Tilletia horrida]